MLIGGGGGGFRLMTLGIPRRVGGVLRIASIIAPWTGEPGRTFHGRGGCFAHFTFFRNLSNEEANELQNRVLQRLVDEMHLEIR
jgi:hypothetical protein